MNGDGRRVESIIGGETTLFVGAHYEVTNGVVTKYYFAGAQRIAMRKNGTLSYMLSDHLGSTSIMTNASGAMTSQMRYKAWGEVRFASGTNPTKYTYTGQYSNVSDFGLMFYNARWYDPVSGRFSQADILIPSPYYSQAYDRYAYAYNSPLRYTDPTGHCVDGITTWACLIAAGAFILKLIDYGWTGYDIYQSKNVLQDANASHTEKVLAGLNVALAIVFEAGEPDDLLPVGIPLDDAGRKLIMKGAKEAFEEGGETGLEKFLREQLGEHADEVLNKIGLNNFRSPELLTEHFNKHAAEFGYKSADEYIQGARALISNTSDDVLKFTRENGDMLFYNPITNEFAVMAGDGAIRTYFKPKDGLNYWLELTGAK